VAGRASPITVIADLHFHAGGEELYLPTAAARVAHRRPALLETARIYQDRADPQHLLFVSEWASQEAHAQRPRLGAISSTMHEDRKHLYYYYQPVYRYEVVGAPVAEVRGTLVRAHDVAAVPAVIGRLKALGALHASNPASVGRFVYQNLDDPVQLLTFTWWSVPGVVGATASRIAHDPDLQALATGGPWFEGTLRAEFPP
jgi:hypothetical protein